MTCKSYCRAPTRSRARCRPPTSRIPTSRPWPRPCRPKSSGSAAGWPGRARATKPGARTGGGRPGPGTRRRRRRGPTAWGAGSTCGREPRPWATSLSSFPSSPSSSRWRLSSSLSSAPAAGSGRPARLCGTTSS
ncbi:MAG: hypothetical protein DIU83_04110 [Bacillota bacterium]|nr:MAG: hypothetical protein DIU83_04110 [Bacillota bacterium]